ncbi:hypothetical protein DFJ77DRAFT_440351 [Powellomyces hirtus]|nr:hypothetical protein DFJ77DRAFT_440351 [Powellomyces hirtus]
MSLTWVSICFVLSEKKRVLRLLENVIFVRAAIPQALDHVVTMLSCVLIILMPMATEQRASTTSSDDLSFSREVFHRQGKGGGLMAREDALNLPGQLFSTCYSRHPATLAQWRRPPQTFLWLQSSEAKNQSRLLLLKEDAGRPNHYGLAEGSERAHRGKFHVPDPLDNESEFSVKRSIFSLRLISTSPSAGATFEEALGKLATPCNTLP